MCLERQGVSVSTLTWNYTGLTQTSAHNRLTVTSDDEISKRVAKFDVNILEEASYILWHIWKERYRGYESLQACITALSVNVGLYDSLKRAHACRSYGAIQYWSACPSLDPHYLN